MASFFVNSSNGSDSNAGTSPSSAWETLDKVASETSDGGHVVTFASGTTYTRDSAAKFWFESANTYTTDLDNPATFAGTGDRPYGVRGNGTVMQNLRLDGGVLSVLHGDASSRVTARLLNVHLTGGDAHGFQQLSGTGAAADSAYLVVGGRYADNGTFGMNLTGVHQSQVLAATFSGNGSVGLRMVSTGTGNVIHGNTCHNNGANGIGVDTPQAGGSGELIEANVCYENANVTNDTSGLKCWSTGATLRANVCFNNGLEQTINHGIQLETTSSTCTAEGNICFGNKTAGISFTNDGHVLRRNVCFSNGSFGIVAFSSNITNCIVDENILASNVSEGFRVPTSVTISGLQLGPNLYNGNGNPVHYSGTDYATLAALHAATSQETAGVEGDPAFYSSAAADFRQRPEAASDFEPAGLERPVLGSDALVRPNTTRLTTRLP